MKKPKFKAGDRVRCISDNIWNNGERSLHMHMCSIGYEYIVYRIGRDPFRNNEEYISLNKDNLIYPAKNFELIQESKMKNMISLRELIEQEACQDMILWFMDFNENKNVDYGWQMRLVLNDLKNDASLREGTKNEWIYWFRDHGCEVDDPDEKKAELTERMDELSTKINKNHDEAIVLNRQLKTIDKELKAIT